MALSSSGIIFITKDNLQIYSQFKPDILKFEFNNYAPEDITSDNKKDYENRLSSFITENNLTPCNLILILSSSIKETSSTDSDISKDKGINQSIPIYLTIKEIFEKDGFKIQFILPASAYSNEITESDDLKLEKCEAIFAQTLNLTEQNLLNSASTTESHKSSIPDSSVLHDEKFYRQQTKRDIMKLYALVSVFGTLIISTLLIFIINPYPQTFDSRAFLEQLFQQEETKHMTVRIIDCANSQAAEDIRNSLSNYGFQSITHHTQNPCPYPQNTIIFPEKSATSTRTQVLTEVYKYTSNIKAIDQTNTVSEITIILYQ